MVKIEELNFRIGNFSLSDINLEIMEGEYFVLLGPTGSGKTTLLKCLLGLNKIQAGKFFIDSKEITNEQCEKRNIGFLPQNYLLFPNMNVYENISYGLKIRKISDEEIRRKVEEIAGLLEIRGILDRGIKNLSGGEMQRVAMARALIINPKLLFLDEPFSSIDEGLKNELWFEIKNILKNLRITVIHITHNLDEAYALADQLGIIINGRIEQVGTPKEIFNYPSNERIANFLGMRNMFTGEVTEIKGNSVIINSGKIKIIAENKKNLKAKDKIKFLIRPDAIKIIREGFPVREELSENIFDAEILSSYFFSDTCIMKLQLLSGDEKILLSAKFPSLIYKRYNLADRMKIKIALWKDGIVLFP